MSNNSYDENSCSSEQLLEETSTNLDSNVQLKESDVSSDDSDESTSDDEEPTSHDILDNPTNPIDQKHLLLYSKYDYSNITNDMKMSCKFLKFSSEWNLEEVLNHIKEFDPNVYQNLFIVAIELEDFQFLSQSITQNRTKEKKLRKVFEKFFLNRPLILQVTSEKEEVSKFYFKTQNQQRFQKIKDNSNDTEGLTDFQSFFWMFIDGRFNDFKQTMFNSLPELLNSSIIYRFMRTLTLSEEYFIFLLFECAEFGSKNDIMAVMNFPLTAENDNIDPNIQELFTKTYSSSNSDAESFMIYSTENSNREVHEFITDCCAKMIGKFEFSFQVEISTTAYEKEKLDYLCDLVDYCDFPFPKDFDVNVVKCERLKIIIEKRNEFNLALIANNSEKINKFIEEHKTLKFVYNTTNSSALHQAVGAKQFQLLNRLESLGFISPEYHNYCEATINKDNKNLAKQIALRKRRENVNKAVPNSSRTVLSLSIKSFIHNKNISVETEAEYRGFILKWLQNIYNDADNKPHLDVVAQCDSLKMIYDFESDEVINIDPFIRGSGGVMHPFSKWIFIGAKTTDEDSINRENVIQGIITHENYHYAMELRYENGARPYFKFDNEREEIFTKIVNDINVWECGGENDPDDECDGIISSVFTDYDDDDFNPELIVRVVQLLIIYANKKDKLEALEKKYKPLFDFHRNYVKPDLMNFNLKDRENVRKFNKNAGILELIQNSTFELSSIKDTSELFEKFVIIVSTNTPILLLLNIYKNLGIQFKNLMDTKSIFISSENLKNTHTLNECKEILRKSSELYIIADCSNGFDERFRQLAVYEKHNFIFIVPDDKQSEELRHMLKNTKAKSFNYSWNDLASIAQAKLLQSTVNFLGNKIAIYELYFKNHQTAINPDETSTEPEPEKNIAIKHLPVKINDELFKLLAKKLEITIGKKFNENDENAVYFNELYRSRNFTRYKKVEECDNGIENQTDISEENSENSQNSTKKHECGPKHTMSRMKDGENSQPEIIETEMTQEEFFKDALNKKIILISDVAGSGKSWVIKIITKMKLMRYPARWTSLVDLKQFINEFKIFQDKTVVFSMFMVEYILKLETLYEKEIFYEMYEAGKVCILFDGFDEIAPNYAGFVKKLFKSLKFNGGNQLWIATRDYFQDMLQDELNLTIIYKLKPFKEEDGIELITSILILYDLETNKQIKLEGDLINQIENHQKYANYRKKARDLNKMICELNNKSIGFPLFFQMIAKICGKLDTEQVKFTISKIFEEFVKIHYERWCHQKGELRMDANSRILVLLLNYATLHQYFAMKGSYPHHDTFCDLRFDSKEWSEEEIVACGLLLKRGDEFQFQHETFREYFIAQFILRILKNDLKILDEEFFSYMKDILLELKFGIVRTFINDSLNEDRIVDKINQIIPKVAESIKNLDFLIDTSKSNLVKLEGMWIEYFRSISYEKLEDILLTDKDSILKIAEDKTLCLKFKKFPHTLLKPDKLYELMKHKNKYGHNFIHIVILKNETEAIKNIIEVMEKTFNETQMQEIIISKGYHGRNLLQFAIFSSKERKTYEYVWNLVRKTCKSDEAFSNAVREVDLQGGNVLQIAAYFGTMEVFDFLIKELENFFSRDGFKKFLKNIETDGINILQGAVSSNISLELYESLWKIIRKYFDLSEILKMIMHEEDNKSNLLHFSILGGKGKIIIKTWEEIRKTVEDSCFDGQNTTIRIREILKSKGFHDRNILQNAVSSIKDKNAFEYVWNFVKKSCESDQDFLEFMKDFDMKGSNFVHIASYFTTDEIFSFIIEELEEIASKEDIKALLGSLGLYKSNLLQGAVRQNNSIDLHECLWKIIRKYFVQSEILNMITYIDQNGENVFHIVIRIDKVKIVEQTWVEIQKIVEESCLDEQNKTNLLQEILKSKGVHGRNLLQNVSSSSKDIKTHEYVWKLVRKSCKSDDEFLSIVKDVDIQGSNVLHVAAFCTTSEVFNFIIDQLEKSSISKEKIKELLNSKGFTKRNLLQAAVGQNNSLKFHECLWKILRKFFDSNEMLKMMTYTDEYNSNLLHFSVYSRNEEIVHKTWVEIVKTVENSCLEEQNKKSQLQEILKSKGYLQQNLLHNAACESKDKKAFQYIWDLVRNSCSSDEEFLEFVQEVNIEGCNIFHLAASFLNSEVFNFIIELLKELTSKNEIEKLLKCIGRKKTNLMQAAAIQNKSSEFHEYFWDILKKYFSAFEILKMINHCDEDENNILHNAVLWNTKEIVELTWNQINKYIEKNEYQAEYLKRTGHKRHNLKEMAAENRSNDLEVMIWIENLMTGNNILFE